MKRQIQMAYLNTPLGCLIDFVAAYNWAHKPTYNGGSLHKASCRDLEPDCELGDEELH